MDDVGFIFLMFFMVVGGTCSIALCIQVLQCCLLRFCDTKEKVNVLQIRSIENPMVGTTIQVGTDGTTIKIEEIPVEEDPKN
jgi:hypothetical protein